VHERTQGSIDSEGGRVRSRFVGGGGAKKVNCVSRYMCFLSNEKVQEPIRGLDMVMTACNESRQQQAERGEQ